MAAQTNTPRSKSKRRGRLPSTPCSPDCLVIRNGEPVEVRVMAIAEGWAMVRRKGAMPFIVREKEIWEREDIV